MPFRETSKMDARLEFVELARQPQANVRALCRRYHISPDTAYRLLRRFDREGPTGLLDRSRRPRHCPDQTPPELVEHVLALRRKHPSWGGRKIHHVLARRMASVPAPSTITSILKRHGLIDAASTPKPYIRFERAAPNELWQMDFKGPMPSDHGDCHPLTVLDDHSRFNILLAACPDQTGTRVKGHLTAAFRRYGLPRQMLSDNGPPWGTANIGAGGLTALSVWLIRVGVDPIHGRFYHPQTQGKEERFHRTLKAAVGSSGRRYAALSDYQHAFEHFRDNYNLERPHEALAMATPASRYQPSCQSFPEVLPPVEYGPGDQVRRVHDGGVIGKGSRRYYIGEALIGQPVALRATTTDGLWEVYFCTRKIAALDERDHTVIPIR